MANTKPLISIDELAVFKQECDAAYGGGGSTTAPIFDATIEEEEGHITVIMTTEDRNDIFANKYPIIGIRIVDEDEETYVLYFKLRQDFVSSEALAYDLWDSDSDEHTISHMNLTFIWDGDDAKVQFDDEELQLGGSGGGSQLEITPTNVDIDFANEDFEAEISSEEYAMILDQQPDTIIFNYALAGIKLYFIKQMLHQAGANDILSYVALIDTVDGNAGSVYYLQMAFEEGEHEIHGLLKDLCKGGGGTGSLKEIDADVTPGDPIIINFRNQDDLDLLKAGTLGQFILNGYVSGQLSGSYGLSISSKVGTEIKYSSIEVSGSDINITTLKIDATDTLVGGSNMYGLTK